MKFFRAIDQGIEKVAIFLLVSGVGVMLTLAVLTIVLRWFNASFLWLDPLVRHLVFTTTFLGGVVATGRGSHIGIDILSKALEAQEKHLALLRLKRLISLVSCLTLAWLTLASWNFMQVEFEYGRAAFLGIHSGFLVGIIPVGVSLIAYRFFYVFLSTFTRSSEVSEC
jgi:TRAP-type C4-dicarboxylate transport system permease small subunit